MKLRNILIVLSVLTFVGASACSTGGGAEKSDESATTRAQAQTAEEAEEEAAEEMEEEEAEEEAAEEMEAAEQRGERERAGSRGMGDEEKRAAKKQKMAGMCPMQVEGTTVKVEKMADAVAMNFTTTGDVEDLRERVQKMAMKHNKHHAGQEMKKGQGMKKGQAEKGKKHGKMHGKKGHMSEERKEMMRMMKQTTAETEQIDGGMRLKLMPDDADQLDALHGHMHNHAQQIQKGEGCPVMMMKGKKAGMAEEAGEAEEEDEDDE